MSHSRAKKSAAPKPVWCGTGVVRSGTINKLAGTYKPEKNLYYRESANKQIKSRGDSC